MFGVNCKTVDIFTGSSLSYFFIIIIITQVVHEYVFLRGKKKEHCREGSKFLWPLSPIPVLSPEVDSQFGTYQNLTLKYPHLIGFTGVARMVGVMQAHVPSWA